MPNRVPAPVRAHAHESFSFGGGALWPYTARARVTRRREAMRMLVLVTVLLAPLGVLALAQGAKNDIVRISMLSRGAASAGVLGCSNALCAVHCTASEFESNSLKTNTSSGRICGT